MELINDGAHQSATSDKLVQSSLKEIEFRKKAAKNMIIIIVTMFLTNLYQTLYSITYALWANEDCYVLETNGYWVQSLSTFMERSI